MESVFEIIAEPNRRAILSLLVSSQQSVGEIERRLRMPQPSVSKHLRVLREAGFVESRRCSRTPPRPHGSWLRSGRESGNTNAREDKKTQPKTANVIKEK